MQTKLLFGIHCHQPVDNFSNVVDEIIKKSYKPFFQTLQKFPNFKCSVHFSGWLLEFIEKNDPELFTLMQRLKDQLEFFTAGFYEPILASIPSRDRIAQIKKLNTYVEKKFAQTPKGAWLTERIWDDSIIDDLVACKIEYVIVDDYHFIAAGFEEKNLYGYYITENGNNKIALFPINKQLRYEIPFLSIEKVKNTLVSFADSNHNNAAVLFDDGEKFGVWPKTYERVYEKGWLEDFLTLCTIDDTISTQTYYEYYKKNKPLGMAYLPTVSYHEMGEWSVSRNLEEKFWNFIQNNTQNEYLIRGGIWKNFFLKYNESNWIHKRMLGISKNRKKTKKYLDNLYKSQCNDVLWHGVFGGIYLPNLRDNAYKYIISCEKEHIKNEKIVKDDIDMDGFEELKVFQEELLTIISVKQGGQIVELDDLQSLFNYQNTMTRYKEYYHNRFISKDENSIHDVEDLKDDAINTIHNTTLHLEEDTKLYYDWYNKHSSIDHISDESFSLESFQNCRFKEYGDFVNQPFQLLDQSKFTLVMQRVGGVYTPEKFSTLCTKEYNFINNKITCDITLQTKFSSSLNYICEWNLHFENYDTLFINGQTILDSLQIQSDSLIIEDQSLKRKWVFHFRESLDVYIYKVNTVSQSETGINYTTQGICLGFLKKFTKELKFSYSVNIASASIINFHHPSVQKYH